MVSVCIVLRTRVLCGQCADFLAPESAMTTLEGSVCEDLLCKLQTCERTSLARTASEKILCV